MKVGIDIDGTITANPIFFSTLIQILMVAGGEVHILTGGIDSYRDASYEFESPSLIKKLVRNGVDNWTTLVRCHGKTPLEVAYLKASYCANNEIDCLFEDTQLYIDEVKKRSPKTQCFLIQ